jgi:hypothetical protein
LLVLAQQPIERNHIAGDQSVLRRFPQRPRGTLAGQRFDVFRKLRAALKTMLAGDDELGVGKGKLDA